MVLKSGRFAESAVLTEEIPPRFSVQANLKSKGITGMDQNRYDGSFRLELPNENKSFAQHESHLI